MSFWYTPIKLLSKFNFAVFPRVQDIFFQVCLSIPHYGLLSYPLFLCIYVFIIYTQRLIYELLSALHFLVSSINVWVELSRRLEKKYSSDFAKVKVSLVGTRLFDQCALQTSGKILQHDCKLSKRKMKYQSCVFFFLFLLFTISQGKSSQTEMKEREREIAN